MATYSIIRERPFYKGVTKDLRSPQKRSDGLTYEEGTIVKAVSLDADPTEACSHGIHFCTNIAGALRFGPVVVEVHPRGAVIDCGDKLRAASVKVGGRVNLSAADLTSADLWGADLSRANLWGARYSPQTLWPEGFDVAASGAKPW